MNARGYIHRFTCMGLAFVRRPISEPAEEGVMAIADDGLGGGWTDRTPAKSKDGKWVRMDGKPLRFKPRYWTVFEVGHRRAP